MRACRLAVYSVWRGDEEVAHGTASQCAKALGVSRRTVQWYATPAARARERRRVRPGVFGTVAEVVGYVSERKGWDG